jgi:hypothetical protein
MIENCDLEMLIITLFYFISITKALNHLDKENVVTSTDLLLSIGFIPLMQYLAK